mmetsp:Transcript_2884/g.6020  ORF Transcript_2884/g.6020 Transcript_2884/m.6020 type:complete len:663 (-) Transcript_2884:56-2044(-)
MTLKLRSLPLLFLFTCLVLSHSRSKVSYLCGASDAASDEKYATTPSPECALPDADGECHYSASQPAVAADSLPVDLDLDCAERATAGDCNYDINAMLGRCVRSCLATPDLGGVGYFDDNGDDDDEDDECEDSLPSEEVRTCEEHVEDGDCWKYSEYMSEVCPKSCAICIPVGTQIFDIGVGQELRDVDLGNLHQIAEVIQVIADTYDYVHGVMLDKFSSAVRLTCRNTHRHCASRAAAGDCGSEDDDDYYHENYEAYNRMHFECGPACGSCDLLYNEELAASCRVDEATDVFAGGDLGRMFERIVGEAPFGEGVVVPDYSANILSRPNHPENDGGDGDGGGSADDDYDYHIGPWIVTLDNFLTDEECDNLIRLGHVEGYGVSTIYGEDGEEDEEDEDEYRTSTNSWCQEECYRNPGARAVIDKIANLTDIPDAYSEYLQLLRYIPGQYYKEHHDYINGSYKYAQGPRMITMFLYLNDVDEGGGTRFTDLGLDVDGNSISMDVQPKRGTALIWPSVLDDDPTKMDSRTFHEALPVVAGKKYGANAWLHLRDFKNDDCDIDIWNMLVGQGEDDDYDSEDDSDNSEEESDGSEEDGGDVDGDDGDVDGDGVGNGDVDGSSDDEYDSSADEDDVDGFSYDDDDKYVSNDDDGNAFDDDYFDYLNEE